jgi:hypothetical protein
MEENIEPWMLAAFAGLFILTFLSFLWDIRQREEREEYAYIL